MRGTMMAAAAVLAVLAGASGAQAATNLVTNGSFTQNNLTPANLTALAGAGRVGVEVDTHFIWANAVTGWNNVNTGSDYNLYFFDGDTAKLGDADSRYPGEQQRPNANFTGDSPDGGAFMVLDGDPGFSGNLEQTIGGLVAGKSYILSFDWAGGELSNRTGYTSSKLTGTFGGDAFSTTPFFNGAGPNAPGDFSGWQHVSFSFTAHSSSQLLSFLAVGAPAGNLPPVAFLDGVSLVGVPEPAVWVMMLAGFGGMGAVLRRRRRFAAA